MIFMLRAYAFGQKRLFFKDFNNLKCGLTCNPRNDYNFERYSAIHNVKSVSQDYQKATGRTEIYYGPLTNRIKALKLFSLLTSCSSFMMQPFIYLQALENDNIGPVLGISACLGFFGVATPLIIHMVTKKYVTHVYYDAKEDRYIANTYSLFARTKQLTFTPEDVVVPDVNRMFANCFIKNTPLFLEQRFFHDSSHFIRIMGFDKPVDFKLNKSPNQTVFTTDCKENKNKK